MEIIAGDIDRAAVGQMSAIGQIHAHDCIAGLQQAIIHSKVCLGTGMRLYIDMIRAEQFLCTVDSQLFHLIHIFAAAIVPFSRIPFRIFVGQHTSLCFHDRIADNIFRCDHFQFVSLTIQFFLNGAVYSAVIFQMFHHFAFSFQKNRSAGKTELLRLSGAVSETSFI